MSAFRNYKTFFHVLHCKKDNTWQVKKDNEPTIMMACDSKQEAIKGAMQLAEDVCEGQREVIVHKTNGTFEWRAFGSNYN